MGSTSACPSVVLTKEGLPFRSPEWFDKLTTAACRRTKEGSTFCLPRTELYSGTGVKNRVDLIFLDFYISDGGKNCFISSGRNNLTSSATLERPYDWPLGIPTY